MDICRVCLSSEVDKDISQLSKDTNKTYIEIMLFCLDIQLTENSEVKEKLCLKCYTKILSFYEFKSLALENDRYLRSLDPNHDKREVIDKDNAKSDLKHLYEFVSEIKEELDVKEEDSAHEYQSDDEVLSVLKHVKYEYVTEKTSEDEIEKKVIAKKRRKKHLKNPKTLHPKDEKKLEVCEECGKTVRNLKEHLKIHQPLKDRKRYKCKVCDKLLLSNGARCVHNKTKHLGIKQHCDICDKDVMHLKRHELRVHNSAALPHECASCGRRFISRSALEVHMTLHTRECPYECDVCQKKFRQKIVMLQHKRQVHEKEKSNLCQFCSKSFFKKYHLQRHLTGHTKEKPYECTECGKMFASKAVLNIHQLIHSKVKMFQCSLCDSRFVSSAYLRTHMVSHTKEKRHPCKYCGVKFGRSDHRKRHEYTAHEKHLVAA